jgi:hypothetical protein
MAILKGHTDAVNSASFSSDGTRVVTASDDGTARLWDGQTGDNIRTLEGHTFTVLSASFSPDGRRIVTASADGTARLWDGQTGDYIKTLESHMDYVLSASFSPDGTRIVTAGDWTDARPLALLGLLPGILLGLILGLRMPIQGSKDSPDQAPQGMVSPDQGIRRSAAAAALAGFAFGLVLVPPATAALVIMGDPNVPVLLSAFALISILAALAYGGLDVLYHSLLRLILAATGQTPWRYVAFLDYAVRRIFLRRPGGSYTFIHRMLRDHFAELYRAEQTPMSRE